MGENADLAREFEANRGHLRNVAHRMLGSAAEAEDAVQEAWLRLGRSEERIENLGGWLTTVVARICLDMLRSRASRREEAFGPALEKSAALDGDPERDALLADALGGALLFVLDTLTPGERLAFVLHDLFAIPFDQIATIIDRTESATRQLASRARRRVQGADPEPGPDPARQREVVSAFLTASRSGELDALLAVLAPDVVLRADAAAMKIGAKQELRGADAVARNFSGRASEARHVTMAGVPGAAWMPGGRLRVALRFLIERGKIEEIELIANPASLAELDLIIEA